MEIAYIALVVLFVVPIGVGIVFWLVHILPEKVAEKRHHPQKDAIHTVCTLSLFFGGILWPIAWIWAYTKPVGYKACVRYRQARGLLQRSGRGAGSRLGAEGGCHASTGRSGRDGEEGRALG